MNPKNTKWFIYDDVFSTQLSPEVFWVPIRELGDTQFTTNEILPFFNGMACCQKQKIIHTLYEAMQLFIEGRFIETDDTQIVEENGIMWEHHKPGNDAIQTNEGCCASDTAWLCYMLDGKYDEVGVFGFLRQNGNGHLLNYIRYGGWLYFIDMLPYACRAQTGIEGEDTTITPLSSPRIHTGNKADFVKTTHFTSLCLKTRSFDGYVRFFNRLLSRKGYEHLFYRYHADPCHPVSIKRNDENITLLMPDKTDIEILGERDCRTIQYEFVDKPIHSYIKHYR